MQTESKLNTTGHLRVAQEWARERWAKLEEHAKTGRCTCYIEPDGSVFILHGCAMGRVLNDEYCLAADRVRELSPPMESGDMESTLEEGAILVRAGRLRGGGVMTLTARTPGEKLTAALVAHLKKIYLESYPALAGALEAKIGFVVDDLLDAKEYLEQGAASLCHEKLESALRRLS